MSRPLRGTSVLIVEDEVIIGMMLFNEIADAGGSPVGPVTSVAAALKEIESQPIDVVILDAKLIDGWGADLAAYLEKRRIPFVVMSGYDKATLPKGLRKALFIAKPISLPILLEAIRSLIPSEAQRTALEARQSTRR